MKATWLSIPIVFLVFGCQSTATDPRTTPELVPPSDEPVAISISIGGVT